MDVNKMHREKAKLELYKNTTNYFEQILEATPHKTTALCYVLTFWPGQKCHSRWCTGRKWHILMAVMRGNLVGGNWLMKWDEVKKYKSHYNLIGWRTGREWPLNWMTVISARWRSHRPFQRKRKWHIPAPDIGSSRGGVSLSPRGSLKVI